MSAKKDKPQHEYAMSSQDRQEKATLQAKASLKSQGIEQPVWDPNLTPEVNYENLKAYSEREAGLIVQFMRQPSGPRPIELDTTNERKEWNRYNDH